MIHQYGVNRVIMDGVQYLQCIVTIKDDEIIDFRTFTEEQQELMKQYKECELIMIDDITEESFIYGFSLAYQLKEESIKKYNIDKVN